MCTTSRRIPASASTHQGPETGNLVLHWGLVVGTRASLDGLGMSARIRVPPDRERVRPVPAFGICDEK